MAANWRHSLNDRVRRATLVEWTAFIGILVTLVGSVGVAGFAVHLANLKSEREQAETLRVREELHDELIKIKVERIEHENVKRERDALLSKKPALDAQTVQLVEQGARVQKEAEDVRAEAAANKKVRDENRELWERVRADDRVFDAKNFLWSLNQKYPKAGGENPGPVGAAPRDYYVTHQLGWLGPARPRCECAVYVEVQPKTAGTSLAPIAYDDKGRLLATIRELKGSRYDAVVELWLSGITLTADDLKLLSDLPHLRVLVLDNAGIDDRALAGLILPAGLEVLSLRRNPITHIPRPLLPDSLREVYLDSTSVRADTLVGLARYCTKLKVISALTVTCDARSLCALVNVSGLNSVWIKPESLTAAEWREVARSRGSHPLDLGEIPPRLISPEVLAEMAELAPGLKPVYGTSSGRPVRRGAD